LEVKVTTIVEKPLEFYSNGYKLTGILHVPDDLKVGERRPGIIVCAGFGAPKELRVPGVCEWLASAGFVALRFDFQGFGQAEGPKWRLMPLEQVQNVRDALTMMEGRDEVDPKRLALYGNSWGGAPAVVVTAIDKRVKALVTNGSPMNGERWMRALRRNWEWLAFQDRLAADRRQRVRTGKSEMVPSDEIMVPDPRTDKEHTQSDKIMTWRFQLPLETGEAIIDFKPEDYAARIAPRPVLFIHCDKDILIPLDEAYTVYAKAGEPKRLMVVEGAQHHDVYYSPWRELTLGAAVDWYREHLRN
jgi:fermentation-respiration switch protein FrsA (DUF1100 family)